MIFTFDPSSRNISSINFIPILLAYALHMIIYKNYVVVLILGIINMVVLSVLGLILVCGLFDFNLYHMYHLRFGAILNNCPRFNV
jgi:hypothetical protein